MKRAIAIIIAVVGGILGGVGLIDPTNAHAVQELGGGVLLDAIALVVAIA